MDGIGCEERDLALACVKFLEHHLKAGKGASGLQSIVSQLEEDGLFPTVVTWTGKRRRGTLKDVTSRYSSEEFAEKLLQSFKRKKQSQTVAKSLRKDWQAEIVRQRLSTHELKKEVAFGKLGGDRREEHIKLQLDALEKSIRRLLLEARVQRVPFLTTRRQADLVRKGGVRLQDRKVALRDAWKGLSFLKKTQGHQAFVFCMICDKTGRWVVTGADDNLVKLWNSRTGYLHTTFWGHSEPISDLAIDSSNQLLASAANDKTIRLWELLTGRCLCVFSGHKESIESICFDAVKSLLISGSNDGSCCVWECDSVYKAVLKLEKVQKKKPLVLPHAKHEGNLIKPVWVNSVSPHPNGRFLATASEDGVARVWDIYERNDQDPRLREALSPPAALINGEYEDGYNRLVASLHAGETQLSKVAWSNCGDRVICVSSKEGSVKLWSWAGSTCDYSITETVPRRLVALSSTQRFEPNQAPQRGRKKVPTLDAVVWSCDDRWIITSQSRRPPPANENSPNAFFHQQIRVWSAAKGELKHILRAHRCQAYLLVAHPSEPAICMSGGHDGLIIVWDIIKGEVLSKSLSIHAQGAPHVLDGAFLPSGSSPAEIACSDSMGRVLLLGLGDGHEYAATPTEQFLENDADTPYRDANNNVIDPGSQCARHLMPRAKLCNASYTPYLHQPPTPLRGEGAFRDPEVKVNPMDNFKQRVAFVRVQELKAKKLESEALERIEHILKAQDQDIADAIAGRLRTSASGTAQANNTTGTQGTNAADDTEDVNAEFRTAFSSDEEEQPAATPAPAETNEARPARRAARRAQGRMRRVQDFLGETSTNQTEEETTESNVADAEYTAEADLQDVEPPLRTRGRPRASPRIRTRTRTRGRGRPRGSGAPRVTPEQAAWIEAAAAMDRSWLAEAPQIGDQLVYIVHAHNHALKSNDDPRPWLVHGDKWEQTWLAVLCRVAAVDYQFPFDASRARDMMRNPSNAINCILKLEALRAPVRNPQNNLYLPTTQWKDISRRKFTFDLKFERHHGLSDFLVFQNRFDTFSQADFTPGSRVMSLPNNPRSAATEGSVMSVDSRQLHGSIQVQWDNGRAPEGHSFWNLYIVASGKPMQTQVKPQKKPNMKPALCKSVARAVEDIASTQPCANAFAQPVDFNTFRDYLSKVPVPMDLQTIAVRLRAGHYRSFRELFSHFFLIRNNCYLYNPPESLICGAADKLLGMLLDTSKLLPARALKSVSDFIGKPTANKGKAAAKTKTKAKAKATSSSSTTTARASGASSQGGAKRKLATATAPEPRRQRGTSGGARGKRRKQSGAKSGATAVASRQKSVNRAQATSRAGAANARQTARMNEQVMAGRQQPPPQQQQQQQMYFNEMVNPNSSQFLYDPNSMSIRDPSIGVNTQGGNNFSPIIRGNAQERNEMDIPSPMSYLNNMNLQGGPQGGLDNRNLMDQRNLNSFLYKQQRYNNGTVSSSSSATPTPTNAPYNLDQNLLQEFF